MKALLSTLSLSLFSAASLLAQGNIVPNTAPTVPIMKSLDQIEPRRPLIAGTTGVAIGASGTITVSQAGSYYLTGNLVVTSGNGVTITASDVTLDLNGFSISSNGTGGQGISLSGGIGRTYLYNGHIKGNYVYSSGSFTGSGFGSGIDYAIGSPISTRVKDITVDGVGDYGIDLGLNESSTVDSCVVRIANFTGIRAGVISDSASLVIGTTPIAGSTVINSIGKKADGTATTSSPAQDVAKIIQAANPRTPISSLPITISRPGSYYFTGNLTFSAATGDAITISAANVSLDFGGFTLSAASGVTGNGINITNASSNVSIQNGKITGTTTVSGSTFTGSGLVYGIYSYAAGSVTVKDMQISGVFQGVALEIYDGKISVVENCTIRVCSYSGIKAEEARRCSVYDAGYEGIFAQTITDSTAILVPSATGSAIYGYRTTDRCYGSAGVGIGIGGDFAGCVSNSYGYSYSGVGIQGTSVSNSEGTSNTGTGIVAETALNCYGRADNGDGIYATVATNCVGYVYNNSAANIALSAITANGCRGSGQNAGTGSTISQSITNKYNMP